MGTDPVGQEWKVEWAVRAPGGNTYGETLLVDREEAKELGHELICILYVKGEDLRERDLDPEEPFAWKVDNGELVTKQISRQQFEQVAESDRDDSSSARNKLQFRAERKLRNLD